MAIKYVEMSVSDPLQSIPLLFYNNKHVKLDLLLLSYIS